MPFGFLLYLLPSISRRGHPALYTILIGAGFSLSIEMLQAFIPQRDSGTTDIITNTLGTAVGVLLARSTVVRSLFERLVSGGLADAGPS
jgi:glycopeptide antibiotics resistance protein